MYGRRRVPEGCRKVGKVRLVGRVCTAGIGKVCSLALEGS